MSQLLPEESPISDLKMDISGSGSSASPANTPMAHPPPSYLESDPDDGLRILKSTSSDSEANHGSSKKTQSIGATSVTPQNHKLDNRQLISVHSHPLMVDEPANDESTNQFWDDHFKEVPLQPVTAASPLRIGNPLRTTSSSPSPKRNVRLDNLSHFSSDSDADLSQYQANVGPSFQSVSLVAKHSGLAKRKEGKSNSCSNIDAESAGECVATTGSIDSLSVRSFDELDRNRMEHFMSRSSSTSMLGEDLLNEPENGESPRRGSNFQKIALPNGTIREIDMKVIEPYKRVLSHGGYLREDCQNAIVIFSSCFLPDRSRSDYKYVMDSLFLYCLKTLEQFVTEDYVLLYLHGGSCKSNVPSFPWLKRCYQLLDRRLRKNLKHVFMVHPTFWLKSLLWMSRPFISSKFWRKLVYVRNLEELYKLVPTVERTAVPEKVKDYDLVNAKKH